MWRLRRENLLYGFDLMGLFYDMAGYVHRIAGGAKPSDMPIEQSQRFYMAVNLKTAALLGVSLSDVFIARANECANETTRVHRAARWRGSLAARGAGAANHVGCWVPQSWLTGAVLFSSGGFPRRLERG